MLPTEQISSPLAVVGRIASQQEDLSIIRTKQNDPLIINASAVYNLRHEMERIRDSFLADALVKQIELSLAIENDLPVVFWDMESMREHFFNNILSNAIRHSPAGSRVCVSLMTLDYYTMIIKISNSASGIAAPERENINAKLCILSHKGTYDIVDAPMFAGVTIKVEVPLYSLCIQ